MGVWLFRAVGSGGTPCRWQIIVELFLRAEPWNNKIDLNDPAQERLKVSKDLVHRLWQRSYFGSGTGSARKSVWTWSFGQWLSNYPSTSNKKIIYEKRNSLSSARALQEKSLEVLPGSSQGYRRREGWESKLISVRNTIDEKRSRCRQGLGFFPINKWIHQRSFFHRNQRSRIYKTEKLSPLDNIFLFFV